MNFQGLALGVVVASYPEGNSVDVLLSDDGSRLSNVQVMVSTGSDSTGEVDLPDIGGPADDTRWDLTKNHERYVRAVVAFLRGVPVVMGFILPQVNQITFAEKNRRVMKHASDVYTSLDDGGNFEMRFPNGLYLRVGTSPDHESLEGKDFDKKFAVTRNTTNQYHVHLEMGGGTASINIAPNGAITVNTESTITAVAGGAVTVEAPSITLDTPQTTCTGHLTVQDGISVSGGSGAAAAITGNVTVTGGNVTADGIGLETHHHTEHDGPSTSAAVA